jgi:hypothetical protein
MAWGGSDYLFCFDTPTWAGAEASCASFGASLATVDTWEENVALSDTAWGWWANYWFIGMNDRAEEGSWVWADATPAASPFWAWNQPDNWDNEDCAHLLFDWYYWNDISCDAALPYVCEYPAP